MDKNISFTLKVWRQKGPKAQGAFETYEMKDIPGDTSFLEMMDILNEQLISEGKEPVVFDHDCREGICGMCSLYINGHPHGPAQGATTCQIYMRRFNDGDVITVEPWRSAGFPVIKDLMVDRTAYDKIMQAGGYVSVNTGAPQDANAILIPKPIADEAMDAASCIGCGACVPPAARQARGSAPRQGHAGQDGRTGLRQLHQHPRLRGRMPEERLHQQHRTFEPRLHPRQAERLIKTPFYI